MLACSCFAGDLGAQSPGGTQILLPAGGEHGVLVERLRGFSERNDWESVLEGLSRYVDLIAIDRFGRLVG